jgi:hypothetical protein
MKKQQIPPAPSDDRLTDLEIGRAVRVMCATSHWCIGRVAGLASEDTTRSVTVCPVDLPLTEGPVALAVALLLPIEGQVIAQRCGHLAECWPGAPAEALASVPCYWCWQEAQREGEGAPSEILPVARLLVPSVAHEMSVIAHLFDESTAQMEEWRRSVASLSKEELLAICHQLGLQLYGKRPTRRNTERQMAESLLEYRYFGLRIHELERRLYDLQRDADQAQLALQTAEARLELARRGTPLIAERAREGLHVWAIAAGGLYECVIVELGKRGDSDKCALCFAHPWEVPQYVRIGWRMVGDLVAVTQ